MKKNSPPIPPFRKLRGYAFDPALSLQMDTSAINDVTYKVIWEKLSPGPVGEYLEIVDYDPTVERYYLPADLNDHYILAQDGLDPSESNPQFHQQMVYAVAMTTIANFEKALGRKILWSQRQLLRDKDDAKVSDYTQRLRIYPHALRDANAYYSPMKKAVLFGYFSAMPAEETLMMPNSLVFTCLSHDIIAHEVTHAILDGMHRNYSEPTNPDVLAFHEAFADIVALFQHFSFPEVLKHQIAQTRGDLSSQNLLGQLAQQFGSAIGSYGSLRDAIGQTDATGIWELKKPDAEAYRTVMEPHERGSILVAAVFEAFLSIYKSRVADLLRIASNGSGILPEGQLHPDLVHRLALEASKAAGHVLNMCIRALDYCPPIDITFGDFLRAIVTADIELVADDSRNYRLAFIDAFRRRGIYPSGIKTLSIESLQQPLINLSFIEKGRSLVVDAPSGEQQSSTGELIGIIASFLRDYGNELKYVNDRETIFNLTRDYIQGRGKAEGKPAILGLHRRLNIKFSGSDGFAKISGLAFFNNFQGMGIRTSRQNGNQPAFQIQNLRLVNRIGPNGTQVNHVIFSLVQSSNISFNEGSFQPGEGDGSFIFRGGCTMIFDLESLSLRYAISKPIVDLATLAHGVQPTLNLERLKAQYAYQCDMEQMDSNPFTMHFGSNEGHMVEPFAFLHNH